uniref:Coiled-coil domain containing 77 n=2 Tax=Macrostomum lignano TaxID=282301 RepID=A0A1I8JHI9_9PLAT
LQPEQTKQKQQAQAPNRRSVKPSTRQTPAATSKRGASSSGAQTAPTSSAPTQPAPTASASHGRQSPTPRDDLGARLALMQPSKELLDYYRRKVQDLDADHQQLEHRLQEFSAACGDQHRLQWELRQREDEIAELQKALSDLQVYLFQERDQVLRLYAENDRLKIKELQDRKKMAHLLQISGVSDSEVTYFLKEPPDVAVVPQKLPGQVQQAAKSANPQLLRAAQALPEALRKTVPALEHEAVLRECDSLRLQLHSLQSQLEEQAKLSKEQVNALMEDRRIRAMEADSSRDRDQDKIKELADKLKRAQEMLQDSTKDLLEQRKVHKQAEKTWIQEKARLLQEIETRRPRYQNTPSERERLRQLVSGQAEASWAKAEQSAVVDELRQQVKTLEYQLQQQTELADMYREQVVQAEDQLCRLREERESAADLYKDRASKIGGRLQLMNQRYAELERRRNLEVEGFKTDIQQLRQKLRGVERQLYKLTIGLGDSVTNGARLLRPAGGGAADVGADGVDMALLKEVRATSGRSKQLGDELKQLKAMMYGLENELRHL